MTPPQNVTCVNTIQGQEDGFELNQTGNPSKAAPLTSTFVLTQHLAHPKCSTCFYQMNA